MAELLLVSWMIGIIYSSIPLFWFAIHPLVQRWRQMRRSPYRILLPLWFAVMAVLGVVTWPWHSALLYSVPWTRMIAAPFVFLALKIYARIRPEFGVTNFIGETELRPEQHQQKLIITGLHAHMRHPIYLAHLCMFCGWTILSGLSINFVLLGISVLVTFPLMIVMEEKELVKRFGQAYREYQRTVPLVPFIWKRTWRNEETA